MLPKGRGLISLQCLKGLLNGCSTPQLQQLGHRQTGIQSQGHKHLQTAIGQVVMGVKDAAGQLDQFAVVTEQQQIANTGLRRSQSYVDRYGAWSMRIGAALFDRSRTLRWWGPEAEKRFFTLRD